MLTCFMTWCCLPAQPFTQRPVRRGTSCQSSSAGFSLLRSPSCSWSRQRTCGRRSNPSTAATPCSFGTGLSQARRLMRCSAPSPSRRRCRSRSRGAARRGSCSRPPLSRTRSTRSPSPPTLPSATASACRCARRARLSSPPRRGRPSLRHRQRRPFVSPCPPPSARRPAGLSPSLVSRALSGERRHALPTTRRASRCRPPRRATRARSSPPSSTGISGRRVSPCSATSPHTRPPTGCTCAPSPSATR
mmetsp:Transcript_14865/g.34033  ORF Transcript_14865/g.34033 Transcript_14865/m.34033 type:complete len:247 (-) Transcript_14865:191-931(-)